MRFLPEFHETEHRQPQRQRQEDDGGYQAALQACKEGGAIAVEAGYAPKDNVTREQMVTILYRYAGSPEVEDAEITFADAADIDGYAQAAVVWAVANQIVKGVGDNLFNPDGFSARAEAAQLIMNFFNK